MTTTLEKPKINTEAYETVSELISSELTNAVGNILKGLEDMANGRESDLASKLDSPQRNQIAKDFIESFSALNVDIRFATEESRAIKERSVTPFILLPSGRSDDEVGTKILAPSRSVKVKSVY